MQLRRGHVATATMPSRHSVLAAHHFFGRRCTSWHRLQRVCCELIFPPHFGQRRLFSFITNVVRGAGFHDNLISQVKPVNNWHRSIADSAAGPQVRGTMLLSDRRMVIQCGKPRPRALLLRTGGGARRAPPSRLPCLPPSSPPRS